MFQATLLLLALLLAALQPSLADIISTGSVNPALNSTTNVTLNEVLVIGVTDDGQVNVTAGDQLNADEVVLSQGANVSSTLTISGNNSRVRTRGVDNAITVGRNGTASVSVTAGAKLNTLILNLGMSNAENIFTVSGQNSLVTVSNADGNFSRPPPAGGFVSVATSEQSRGELRLTSAGKFTVTSVGSAITPTLLVAAEQSSQGVVSVDGNGSALTIISANRGANLGLGGLGRGVMTLTNRASVTISGDEVFASISSGGGKLSNLAQSSLTILGGSQFLVDGDRAGVIIGIESNANGLVRVSGANSRLNVQGAVDTSITVGQRGRGALIIENGATVDPTFVSVATEPGSRGELSVSGNGSKLSLSQPGESLGTFLDIGRGSQGDAEVVNGGRIEIIDDTNPQPGLQLGRDTTGEGSLTISGSNSTVTIASSFAGASSGQIIIGGNGQGTVTMTSGASLINDTDGISYVGRFASAVGAVNLTGTNTLFAAGSQLLIGKDLNPTAIGGMGNVTVNTGAAVTADTIELGENGVLAGDGLIMGDVNNLNGQLRPGDDVGTLELEGDFSQSDGVLELQLEGKAAGQFDVLAITGAADLQAGTIRFRFSGSYLPQQGDRITFLTTTTGVTLNAAVQRQYSGAEPGFNFSVIRSSNGRNLIFVANGDAQSNALIIDNFDQ